jgi:hypothetical protein
MVGFFLSLSLSVLKVLEGWFSGGAYQTGYFPTRKGKIRQ